MRATAPDTAGPTGPAEASEAIEDLLPLGEAELRARLGDLGMPGYRARQILDWVFSKRVLDFAAMSNISRSERELLARRFRLEPPDIEALSPSADGLTQKLLLRLADGAGVEGVLMLHPRRRATLCLSSQVGCAQRCVFCATGRMGLLRDMSAAEILAQLMVMLQRLVALDPSYATRHPTLVFMGMGEPMDNADALLAAIARIVAPDGFGIASRKITVSTLGSPAFIDRLARTGLQVNLAISLHSALDERRARLAPRQRSQSVADLLAAAQAYHGRTGRLVTLEYVMLDGLNDGPDDARALAAACRSRPFKVNLIPYNPIPGPRLETSSKKALRAFSATLEDAAVPVTIRYSQGSDVAAACGQLAGRREAVNGRLDPAQGRP